jgi:nicotinamide-nucleotide amidase
MDHYVELICVGNELLIGKTLNTNSQWLAKRITSLGLATRRITVVGDTIDQVSASIKEAIQRKPTFLLTTGGLGPTFDDKTLEGIAEALERKIEINEDALKMVKEKYLSYTHDSRTVELTPHRKKMAKLPEGATPLPNPVGTAPAAFINYRNVNIIALPGVPFEMKSIFNESIAPLMKEAAEGTTFFGTSIFSTDVMESEIAPLIDVVMHDNPHIYIKSHPQGSEEVPYIEFHLSTTAKDVNVAKQRINKALIQLVEMVKNNGGKIKSTKLE